MFTIIPRFVFHPLSSSEHFDVVHRLKPFHVKLLGVRKSPWGSKPQDSLLEAELEQKGLFEDLIPLAAQADLVVLTCSVTDETRNMVNHKFLQACKPGVRIINVARGKHV